MVQKSWPIGAPIQKEATSCKAEIAPASPELKYGSIQSYFLDQLAQMLR